MQERSTGLRDVFFVPMRYAHRVGDLRSVRRAFLRRVGACRLIGKCPASGESGIDGIFGVFVLLGDLHERLCSVARIGVLRHAFTVTGSAGVKLPGVMLIFAGRGAFLRRRCH